MVGRSRIDVEIIGESFLRGYCGGVRGSSGASGMEITGVNTLKVDIWQLGNMGHPSLRRTSVRSICCVSVDQTFHRALVKSRIPFVSAASQK